MACHPITVRHGEHLAVPKDARMGTALAGSRRDYEAFMKRREVMRSSMSHEGGHPQARTGLSLEGLLVVRPPSDAREPERQSDP